MVYPKRLYIPVSLEESSLYRHARKSALELGVANLLPSATGWLTIFIYRGIGLAIGQSFAEAGAHALALVHSSVSQAAAAERAVQELRTLYPSTVIVLYRADVSLASEIEEVVQKVVKEFARLDVVVANAGVYTDTPALDMTPEEAQQITNVNYFGVLYTAQSAARLNGPVMLHQRPTDVLCRAMKQNGGGRLIVTASIKFVFLYC
jgi:sorbose reductase